MRNEVTRQCGQTTSATNAARPPNQAVSAKSSGKSDAKAAVQNRVRQRQRSVKNAGFRRFGNEFNWRLRYYPIERCEQRRRQHRRVGVIRALLVVVAMRSAETWSCGVKHACHLVAVQRHAVRGGEGRSFNSRCEQAWTSVCRHRHLREQDRGDQQSTQKSTQRAVHREIKPKN